MDWFMIVIAVLVSILLVGISVYLVILYSSEEDRTVAWLPKIICVFGISLACMTVFLLPFDVANRREPTNMKRLGGGLNTVLMWNIVLWTTAAMVIIIIPFATFYYEAYDPDQSSVSQQLMPAFLYTFAMLLLFGILVVVLWLTVGVAEIPYYSYTALHQCVDVSAPSLYYYTRTIEKLRLNVSIFVYVVAMLSFVGWILFFVYGGVGLVAFPVDIMVDFMARPKPISAQQYARETEVIAAKAFGMMTMAKKLTERQRKKNNTKVRSEVNALRMETLELEKQMDRLDTAYKEQGGNPLVVFGMLFLGVAGFGLSLLWIVHIFLYNTLDVHAFLNNALTTLDNAFALLGVIAYGILSLYLLACTIKGCIKVGMRIVFFQIHPMKPNDTPMNSLLFNTGLILLASVTVTQFCAMSFRDYAALTAVDTLLNVYVLRLKGIGLVIAYMQFFFVAVCVISIFWVMLCPKPKPKKKRDDDDDD